MDTAKQFPANYSDEVLKVLSALSMTKLKGMKLVGSSSLRSQLYAGDYDAMETVNAKSATAVLQSLQTIVKRLRDLPHCYIGDIKCGEVGDWEIVPSNSYLEDGKLYKFNIKESQSKVDDLRAENILTEKEARDANELLEKATTPFEFLTAKKELRFHILRWKPVDILQGALEYRGKIFTLEDAIQSGGMIKVDLVYDLHDRFTEFSCIYDVFIKGVRVTMVPPPLVRSLTDDILYYERINPFKALKRFFALERYFKNEKTLLFLIPILNGDLGRLYQITEDLKTLLALLERPSAPVQTIRSQIDEVRQRLGNIYQFKDLLKEEYRLIGKINSVLKQSNPKLKDKLALLIQDFQTVLNENTTSLLKSAMKITNGKH
jgi:hypothetical protein